MGIQHLQLSFLTKSFHTSCLALNIYAPLHWHCQFSNIKPCCMSCHRFLNDRMISTNIRKSNTSTSPIKAPQKIQETHVWENPYKAPFVLLRYVYLFCCYCSSYTFSLDFSMLLQDLDNFQKYLCLHASRMRCDVCLLIKFQLVKEV